MLYAPSGLSMQVLGGANYRRERLLLQGGDCLSSRSTDRCAGKGARDDSADARDKKFYGCGPSARELSESKTHRVDDKHDQKSDPKDRLFQMSGLPEPPPLLPSVTRRGVGLLHDPFLRVAMKRTGARKQSITPTAATNSPIELLVDSYITNPPRRRISPMPATIRSFMYRGTPLV